VRILLSAPMSMAAGAALVLLASGCDPNGSHGADPSARSGSPVSSFAAHPDRFLGSEDPGFVGDAACVPCHGDVVDRYRDTNHGRSLSDFDPASAPERFGGPSLPGTPGSPVSEGWIHSPVDGLHYQAALDGDRLVQREVLRTEDGRGVAHDVTFPADQVIGSGNQTRSFLMIRNGRVTQMPLTWYAHQARWDLSPGYAEANDRFSRPIILQCLACHGDLPRLEPHTQNVFAELPRAISCERCHGPGADHVDRRVAGDAPGDGDEVGDPWIVNPARLDRTAELAVCAQCHLAGVIAYPDREDPMTFRPGMELAENRAVYVPALQLEDPDWVGIDSHPIRLARSACFQATEMTCTTCHLSHTAGTEVPPDHFRSRCVDCHGGMTPSISPTAPSDPARGGDLCSRPGVASSAEAVSGDCVGCHLTAGGTSDVPHVRFTDHWIQRVPRPPLPPEAGRPVIDSPVPVALVEVSALGMLARPELLLHRSDALQSSLRTEALFHFYETMHRHSGYLSQVVAAGREALGAEPGGRTSGDSGGDATAEARIALARALLEMDSVTAAEGVLEETVRRYPEHPWSHFILGALLDERRGRPADALPHLDRALALQPRLNEARAKRAEILYALGRRGEALRELERVVEDEPVHRPRSWFNLGILRREMGDAPGAALAFQAAADTDPRNAEPLLQLGTLQMEQGDLEAAEAIFRRAVAADPDHPGAHGSLALVLLEVGRVDEGRARLRRVLELDPGNQAARNLLAEVGG
jgi:tetratricopeptide (TPR) repeat protein